MISFKFHKCCVRGCASLKFRRVHICLYEFMHVCVFECTGLGECVYVCRKCSVVLTDALRSWVLVSLMFLWYSDAELCWWWFYVSDLSLLSTGFILEQLCTAGLLTLITNTFLQSCPQLHAIISTSCNLSVFIWHYSNLENRENTAI